MSRISTTSEKTKGSKQIYINGLSVLSSFALLAAPALAQDAGMGLDQDSLLPPEVVPLDPAAATRMTQSQAQSRAASMGSGSSQSVPGLASNSAPVNPPAQMQSAQDYRKDMFNSLYNQATTPQNNGAPSQGYPPNLQSQGPGQYGQMPNQNGQMQNQMANGMPNQNQQFANQGQMGYQSANNNAQQAQSQTLTGAAQQNGRNGNSKMTGAMHAVGMAAGIGGALAISGLMFRNGASASGAGLGTALMGASLMNYVMRAGMRF